MRFKGIIFDLDGTLLDTVEDLANSMNSVLTRMGFPGHPVQDYKVFVGDGMETLALRVLPVEHRDGKTVAQCLEGMKKEYAGRWSETTLLYEGIADLVDKCRERGFQMAVLSNKADEFTKRMVAHFFDGRFSIVIGGGIFPKKPDPAAPLHIADLMGLEPWEILYVGDTDTDMKTACAAGMTPVGALWGFRTKEELLANGAQLLVAHPSDVLDILLKSGG